MLTLAVHLEYVGLYASLDGLCRRRQCDVLRTKHFGSMLNFLLLFDSEMELTSYYGCTGFLQRQIL